jgi:hypothetical protein
VRGRAVAAHPSTLYRLDAAGEVYEMVVEQADEELQLAGVPAASSTDYAEQHFDVTTWWSKQLGATLNAH